MLRAHDIAGPAPPPAAAPGRWVAGLDLGGTRVRAAAVAPDGAVLASTTQEVDRRPGAAHRPFGQLVGLVLDLADAVGGGPPAAIAAGVTGPIDVRTGIVDNPYTLPEHLQGDLRGALHDAFGVPVHVENDADAAALGERWAGAARGAEVVVCVTVGTGIGVGVVGAGTVRRGAGGAHGEAGHLVVDPSGPPCYCGAHGCVESLASGTALAARARAAGAIAEDETAAAVLARAAAGEPSCAALVAQARAALATGVRNLVAVHAPDAVVLAGGALPGAPETLAACRAAVAAFTLRGDGPCAVVLSELGDLAGCLGAASVAWAP